MARAVHKYEVASGVFAPVTMPAYAQIVHADVQGEKVFVWALVQPENLPVLRHLGYFGTGRPIPDDAEHIGSCIERSFGLVWHVFERSAPEVVSDIQDVVDGRTEVPA